MSGKHRHGTPRYCRKYGHNDRAIVVEGRSLFLHGKPGVGIYKCSRCDRKRWQLEYEWCDIVSRELGFDAEAIMYYRTDEYDIRRSNYRKWSKFVPYNAVMPPHRHTKDRA